MYLRAAVTSVLLVVVQLGFADCDCSNPVVRKEWRALSNSEKLAYIDAVKCLQFQPSQLGHVYDGARCRFDDFQATHINNTDYIHWVGFFQPLSGGIALSCLNMSQICGAYAAMRGPNLKSDLNRKSFFNDAWHRYWDWTLDVNTEADFPKSPVFDPVYGFGGNGAYINTTLWANISQHVPGKTGGGCISTGPFANMSVNMGPGANSFSYNPRCLTRDFSPWFATRTLNASVVASALRAPDFYEFDRRVEGGVTIDTGTYHSGGHKGVGGDTGEITDLYSSPGEPVFYLHHANIDRLWDLWQRLDWPSRKYDISGPDTAYAYPFNFYGDKPYRNITLDYQMDFQGLLSTDSQIVAIDDVMDIQGGRLCYTYA
ncbi:uncharacterized protein V1513DRAFT_431073 [Lipomyces chichibuensis]|uniref:uncharacterized protein n=1 Tax=Lipomyces chichibuensis TaxID=1546026 RepID=UPI0033439524